MRETEREQDRVRKRETNIEREKRERLREAERNRKEVGKREIKIEMEGK